MVARRAALEDDIRALETGEGLDLAEVLDLLPSEAVDAATAAVRRLHGLAGGRLAVMKEMREMDDRLGLTPKGQAQLRWTIVGEEKPKQQQQGAQVRRLRAVDPSAS